MKKNKSLKIILLALLAVLVLAFMAGSIYENAAEKRERAQFTPLGSLVSVNGRQMHLYCLGEASPNQPTVILEAGGGENLYTFYNIQQQISQFARVCAYDRAGLGWSEPVPGARSAVTIADELYALLQAAGEAEPYVLAGHSFGGLIMRIFAARHPQATAGLLLIDSTNAEDMLRQSAFLLHLFRADLAAGVLLQQAGALRLFLKDPAILSESLLYLPDSTMPAAYALYLRADGLRVTFKELWLSTESSQQAVDAGSLGDLPVIAFVTPAEEDGSLPDNYLEDFAALSSNATVTVLPCGHYIHLEQPQVILDALQTLLNQP